VDRKVFRLARSQMSRVAELARAAGPEVLPLDLGRRRGALVPGPPVSTANQSVGHIIT